MPAPHLPAPHRVVAVAAALVAVIAGRRRGAPHHVGALRAALDGLRTMATLAWFPLVLLLFQVTETAILVRDAVRAPCTEAHRCKR